MRVVVSQLLTIHSTDPDDARRRRLLNILLVSVALLTILGVLFTIVLDLTGLESKVSHIYLAGLVTLVGLVIIFVINRYWSGEIASSLLLLLIAAAISFDTPQEIVNGRSLFMYVIPILMASVLLRPYASFIAASLITVLLTIIALNAQIVPNLIATMAFFAVAAVSWLSARSLEHALKDLRTLNIELEQRVADRTHDLAQALTREHAEASKNQAVLEGIADGVIVFDNNNTAVVANPAVSRLMGQLANNITGRNIEEIMGHAVATTDQEVILSLLKNKGIRRPSIKIGWGEKTLSVSFAPVYGDAANEIGTVAVFRDFTQEAEIDRMKSDFVSIASHELRTPLTSIRGYLDLVLMGASGALNEQQQNFVQIAKDNTERLHDLVNDLLDVSRIESGKIELRVERLAIAELINKIASFLQKQFDDKGLTLIVDVPPNLPRISGDANRLNQVITNLLGNAYKYTPEGQVTIRARQVNNSLQVDVTDSGVGISAEDQKKLFTRFFRTGDTYVRQQSGTGLGLNITKSLIEMHGGKIWVESRPGAGSTFSFSLPLLPEQTTPVVSPEPAIAQASPPSPKKPAPSASARILIANSDANIARTFKNQLEAEGYQVTVVSQGRQIVSRAREFQPNLIALDSLMEVDGLTLLESLKADPSTATIPVVVTSIVPNPDGKLAMGATDYLGKPLSEDMLLNSIRRLVGQSPGAPQQKILIVDDERDVVNWAKYALSRHGFYVLEAYDGFQALEVASTRHPDLIVLDLMMPGMDGRTVLYRLREQKETQHIPVVVLTALSLPEVPEHKQMLGMGVKEFLHKPLTVEEFVTEIKKHLVLDASKD